MFALARSLPSRLSHAGADLSDTVRNALTERRCVFRGAERDDTELISPIPAEAIEVRVRVIPQDVRDCQQHFVADDMAVLLVEFAKAVQVEKKNGDLHPSL